MQPVLSDLLELLEEVCGSTPDYECVKSTYLVEGNGFSLAFMLDDDGDILTIQSIEANGLGSDIIEAVHSVADDHGCEVRARKVKSSAVGFWEKMGYVPGVETDEYYRVQ